MNWRDLSEIVAGKVIAGVVPAGAVDPDTLCEPYPKLIRVLSRKKSVEPELAVELIGIQAYASATQAASATEGMPTDFVQLLSRASARFEAAEHLEKLSKSLKAGEDTDLSSILPLIDRASAGERAMIKMSQVKPEKEPFLPIGWEAIDFYTGGVPKVGITLVAGPPGTGKTTFMVKAISAFARKYDVDVGIFTLEMTNAQLAARAIEISELSKKTQDHIYLCEDVIGPNELVSLATRGNKFKMIAVDFAELMIDGDVSESIMAKAYRTLGTLAKNMKIPIIVLSQLNRSYDGSLPRLNMIRYTGLGEALTPMALLLYNPNAIFVNPDAAKILPVIEDHAYILQAKSRFGYKRGGPGAILMPFKGAGGWGDKGLKWVPLSASNLQQ